MLRGVAEQIKIHRYHILSSLYITSEQLTVYYNSLVVVYNRKNITNIFTIHTLCASRGKKYIKPIMVMYNHFSYENYFFPMGY